MNAIISSSRVLLAAAALVVAWAPAATISAPSPSEVPTYVKEVVLPAHRVGDPTPEVVTPEQRALAGAHS